MCRNILASLITRLNLNVWNKWLICGDKRLTLLVGMDLSRLKMASISFLLGASAIAVHSTFGSRQQKTNDYRSSVKKKQTTVDVRIIR